MPYSKPYDKYLRVDEWGVKKSMSRFKMSIQHFLNLNTWQVNESLILPLCPDKKKRLCLKLKNVPI